MKIVHVMISAFYKEGYGYQENILAAKHHQLGHNVTIVTYDRYNAYGNIDPDEKGIKTYINVNDLKVVVLPDNDNFWTKLPLWVFKACINRTKYLYETLMAENPDIIFTHGIQAPDHELIVKYKQNHRKVKVYIDNHADYYNCPISTFSQRMMRKVIGGYYVRHMAVICEKVWGVTPWRIDYLREVYGVTGPKVGLLVMGGDESCIDWNNRTVIRRQFRKEHGIPEDAFVVVTGGKIDKAKNIHLLIDAVENIDDPLLFLVIFGNYSNELRQYTNVSNPRIINIGWVNSNAVYSIFLSSDLGAFPGTHSVLWEQACASGLPCLFKDWDGGFNHVDMGGNCILMKDITVESLANSIKNLKTDKVRFSSMRKIAEEKCRKEFSYIEIAKKAIESD